MVGAVGDSAAAWADRVVWPQQPDADIDASLLSVNPSATLRAPSINAPDVNAPNLPDLKFAPLSILRSGNGFTLDGELPSLEAKTGFNR